jgi:transketolase C-terminal domain/subunit
MAEGGCGARLIRLGTRDIFGESASADELLQKHGLTPLAIVERLRREFGR